MPTITGLAGLMGSGKSHRANEMDGVIIPFAGSLKDIACKLLWGVGKEDDCFFEEGDKTEDWRGPRNTEFTGREFLQRLGATIRETDPDFWVNLWSQKVIKAYQAGDNVIVPDVRYLNEFESLYAFEGIFDRAEVILCNYKSYRYDDTNTHESEKFAKELLKLGKVDGDLITRDYKYGS